MSGAVPVIVAAALNAITVGVPSVDGARGIEGAYERWLPCHRISVAGSMQLRESATGDYGGLRAGLGAELRFYWRARSFLHAQPTGSMIGWFVGGRIDLSIAATHDRIADRWLGTALEIGLESRIGYRFAPWRGLEITPTTGLTWRHDTDLSGRLPGWSRPGISGGLSVGWLF